jgi:ketosteroid isomerase-like protein
VGEVFDAFGRGELEALLERVDPEVVIRDPGRTGTTFSGRDALLRFWGEWLEMWDDYRVEPVEVIERGEEVFVACQQSGRGRSGIEVGQDLFIVLRIPEERVTEYRIYAERDEALASVGRRSPTPE